MISLRAKVGEDVEFATAIERLHEVYATGTLSWLFDSCFHGEIGNGGTVLEATSPTSFNELREWVIRQAKQTEPTPA